MYILSHLQAIVGSENATDLSRSVSVSPETTEEVSAALRFCSANSLAVSPLGGGTKQGWGHPVEAAVHLDLKRLSGVREHVWQDMTATVGAGTLWTEMQSAFAQHGQRVALDPLFANRSTVGGILAVNDSGALRIKYGSLRDLVLGMTIVLADGTIARSGGKVVKNVAGYDLPKLMIGSFGTLGIVTEVNFRLHPLEQQTQTWTVRGDAAALGELMQLLRQSATTLQSLQLRSDGPEINLDVRFASAPAALESDAARFAEMCANLSLQQSLDDIWSWREQLFANQEAAVLKITCLPTQIAAIVDGFSKCGVAVRCAAEAVGIITAQLEGDPELISAVIDDLRARLRSAGGLLVVLQWPFESKEVDRWGGSTPAVAMMRELKHQFDPDRLLNPGKFVGGI